MRELHPFWKGIEHELRKVSFLEELPGLAMAHPLAAAGVGALGLAAGLKTVKGLRALQGGKPLFGKMPTPPTEAAAPAKGFSGKALLASGAAGLGAGYYLSRKKEEQS